MIQHRMRNFPFLFLKNTFVFPEKDTFGYVICTLPLQVDTITELGVTDSVLFVWVICFIQSAFKSGPLELCRIRKVYEGQNVPFQSQKRQRKKRLFMFCLIK